jgi:hypothetical protein
VLCVANPNDFIEIKFDLATVDNKLGLHSYMNTMINTNADICKYQLRKISHYWGYIDKDSDTNFVYYMLAPPWLKIYVVSEVLPVYFFMVYFRMTLLTNLLRR